MEKSHIEMFTSRFTTLEKWVASEENHIIKDKSLKVQNVIAFIEKNDKGYFLSYSSPNLNYTVKSMPILTIELDRDENCYIISTDAIDDTVYYKLKY